MAGIEYSAQTHTSLHQLAAHWDDLHGSQNPFIASGFLLALEDHGALDNNLGWQACHLAVQQDQQFYAAAPGYLTTHSFGDFVYDWDWAQMAAQAGFSWYPKWVIEAPYSPVTGPRLLTPMTADGQIDLQARKLLIQAIQQLADQRQIACVQVNYCSVHEAELLAANGFLINRDQQFHWQCNNATDFDGFLERLRNKRRKEIRRERNKVKAQGITHHWINGVQASPQDLSFMHQCYVKTFHEKGNFPAISLACLQAMAKHLGERLLICMASLHGQAIAAALMLRSDTHLYGRYWGAMGDYDCLHFETCYYQGIEYCLEHGLDVFEPGAGGGHKYHRGFTPVDVYTCHWFPEPQLRQLMAAQLLYEAKLRHSYEIKDRQFTPFKRA